MNEDKVLILTGHPVEIASDSENPDNETCKYATFLISVLDEFDRVGRMIPLESGEKYHSTLRGFPVVAKLLRDRSRKPVDFGAHEMRQWKNRKGETETTFDTYPIGSVIDTWIEEREVAGYTGAKKCIMAKAKLWVCRSPEYFKVLDKLIAENKVSSSWELITNETEELPLGKKILKAFSFIGNALLGTNSIPAVKGAGIYEYAEFEEKHCDTNEELNNALLKDILSLEERKEDSLNPDETKIEEPESEGEKTTVPEGDAVPEGAEKPIPEEEPQTPEEENKGEDISKPEGDDTPKSGGEEEKEKTESAVDDIAKLSEALLQANEIIQQLKEQVESFAPIKAEYDRMTTEKAEAEKQSQIATLREKILKTKQISEAELEEEGGNEEIKSMLANLDEDGLNRVVVSRLTESFSNKTKEFNAASIDAKSHKIRRIIGDFNGTTNISDDKKITGESLVKSFIAR